MTTWDVTTTTQLTAACAGAAPGDTVSITGSFSGYSFIPRTSGTAGNPITYKASSPGAAIFDSAGMSSVLLNVGGARSYLTFDGIAFTNTPYSTKPAANKGMLLRGNHHIVQNCVMSYMQMQLIGASYCQILNNSWRYFVAVYISGEPQTAGDMLNLGSTSHDNTVSGNDMKYAGHALIAVGDGIGGTTNANNWIHGNTLSNPWYKNVILGDDGGGTVVENNRITDTTTQPALYSTVQGASGVLVRAADAIQFSGSNFIVRNNIIDNTNCTTNQGIITLGARWYYGTGAPVGGAKVESKNNQIYGNTIQNSLTGTVFSFVQNYTAGTDPSEPFIAGNLIHDNTIINVIANPASNPPTYRTVYYRSFKGATPWTGLDTNSVHDNWGFDSTAAYVSDYVNQAGASAPTTKTLAQFNGLDANVYSNSASQPPVAPTADFSLTPSTGLAPLSVAFTDTSTGTPTSWAWNFGDAATSTSQNPSHSFTSVGLYTVTLTATNAGGSTNKTATVTVTAVPPVPPTADFSYQLTSGVLTVTFTDTSTGTPTSWSWDFGDGTTSTSQNPSHTFATGGSFAVVLTSTNGNGSTTRTKTLAVTAPMPPFVVPPTGLTLTPVVAIVGSSTLCSETLACSSFLACSDLSIGFAGVTPGTLSLAAVTPTTLTLVEA